ncbi:MAG: hypothetical protein ACHQ4F_09185, partial [Candidatus Dormibacteria bacterium]
GTTPGPSAMRRVSSSTGRASATTRRARERLRSSMTRQGRLPVVGADLYYDVEGQGRRSRARGPWPHPTVVVGELDVPCLHSMAGEISRRVPSARSITIANAAQW